MPRAIAEPAAAERLPHYVAPEPFDPHSVEKMTPEQERYYLASQWRMMWWKLRRHRLAVISGAEITAVVLSLPTTGPMLLAALKSQDMYLAGSFLMFMATLTVIGVFLSDLALAWLDPRIRLEGGVTR